MTVTVANDIRTTFAKEFPTPLESATAYFNGLISDAGLTEAEQAEVRRRAIECLARTEQVLTSKGEACITYMDAYHIVKRDGEPFDSTGAKNPGLCKRGAALITLIGALLEDRGYRTEVVSREYMATMILRIRMV